MAVESRPLLANGALQRISLAAQERLTTGKIKNCITGSVLKTGEEFSIRLARLQVTASSLQPSLALPSEDFLRVEAGHRMGKENGSEQDDLTAQIVAESRYINASEFELIDWKKRKEGATQLTVLRLRHSGEGIAAEVGYELRADEPCLRKRLELRNTGPGQMWLVDLDLDTFCTCDWRASSERGFPVFIGSDIFVGIEFPSWSKVTTDSELILRQHPGKLLQPGESLTSKTVVIGVSQSGEIEQQFRHYLADLAPAQPRETPVSVYNDWGTHGSEGATQEQTFARLSLLEQVKAKYGLKFDYYTLDDGWAERVDEPWHIRKGNWPKGFEELVERLEKLDAKLGLWMNFRCLTERKYWQSFRDGVFRLIDQYQLGWIKFDGGTTQCAEPGHGHLATSEHSQEAIFEALIELIAEIRTKNPQIIIQHHWGINRSPWWVIHYDMLLCGLESIPHLGSVYLPALNLRESLDVGLDQVELVRHRDHFLPWHIIDDNGLYLLEPMDRWENNLVLSCLGRGNGRVQIYAKLELLRERDWIFLQAVWHLLEKHFYSLIPTRKILGIPEKGEVYGYAHFSDNQGFFVLCNPSFEKKTVRLRLADYLASKDPSGRQIPYRVRSIYPRDEEVLLSSEKGAAWGIGPYEVLLLEAERAEHAMTRESLGLPLPSTPPVESSRKLSYFQEDQHPELSKVDLQQMLERIKFSLPDSTFCQDSKGWLKAPGHARWWVNPRGRTTHMCYRLDLGRTYQLGQLEMESAAFPPEYSLYLSKDLIQWSQIGPRKGAKTETLDLLNTATRYIKLVPHWEGQEAEDWSILDIRLYQDNSGKKTAISSANWFRNGLFSHQSRVTHLYRAGISLGNSLESKSALKEGLLCVPLQTKLDGKRWYHKPICGYTVPHNHIFLIARSTDREFLFQPIPALRFITEGSWVTFTHPVEPLVKAGDLELVGVVADAPGEVVLDGGVYWLA